MTGREMSANMQSGVAARGSRIFRLIEIAFDAGDGGTQYYTDCYRDLTWNGNTYLAQNLIATPDLPESLPMDTPEISIALSGVTQANLAIALSSNYIDRDVTIYRGLLDASEAIVADPIIEWLGELDRPGYDEDPTNGSATLTWYAVSQFARFDKIGGRMTNNADQQVWFPGDKFFEFADQVDKDIPWGRPS